MSDWSRTSLTYTDRHNKAGWVFAAPSGTYRNEAKQQAFKRSGLESITELKYTQAKLRREIAWSKNANTK
jgi:hypothetical protein